MYTNGHNPRRPIPNNQQEDSLRHVYPKMTARDHSRQSFIPARQRADKPGHLFYPFLDISGELIEKPPPPFLSLSFASRIPRDKMSRDSSLYCAIFFLLSPAAIWTTLRRRRGRKDAELPSDSQMRLLASRYEITQLRFYLLLYCRTV